jgi:hypothetical protein
MQNTTTKILTALGAIAAAVAIAFLAAVLMAYPVKWLWNWLVPSIFGLRPVSALEAWGLTLLLQLLLPKPKTSDKS